MSAGKPAKWSENEKVSFLVQAIQALSGSSGFPYDSVSLPGRTKRSMMHAWTAARTQHAAFMAMGDDDSSPVTPTPASRGKKSKKRKTEDFGSDDDEDIKPRVKKALTSSASRKKSAKALDGENGKIKGEPQSSADESNDKLANDEA
ncbi:uncharacterized protein GGS22DRAFT_65653 [Annulohypoxylon maeteangense]|uniref:uncharacterized protein n=1 Tax=Annulohypoxylon maeteangense TaxID=1927788 RepID=UPI0020088769|nr:uncharacterized protein GGS22DRAFT_65653 [Annulohypoxylon maeteangense]KAI0888985.1 hypothetical protein GGS22DRAFT_65653 [Annulohypoxylon maeteangense]